MNFISSSKQLINDFLLILHSLSRQHARFLSFNINLCRPPSQCTQICYNWIKIIKNIYYISFFKKITSLEWVYTKKYNTFYSNLWVIYNSDTRKMLPINIKRVKTWIKFHTLVFDIFFLLYILNNIIKKKSFKKAAIVSSSIE